MTGAFSAGFLGQTRSHYHKQALLELTVVIIYYITKQKLILI